MALKDIPTKCVPFPNSYGPVLATIFGFAAQQKNDNVIPPSRLCYVYALCVSDHITHQGIIIRDTDFLEHFHSENQRINASSRLFSGKLHNLTGPSYDAQPTAAA